MNGQNPTEKQKAVKVCPSGSISIHSKITHLFVSELRTILNSLLTSPGSSFMVNGQFWQTILKVIFDNNEFLRSTVES